MTLPHTLIKDPFDLLETDNNVVPVLPKNKLATMIDQALTHEQMMRPQQKKTTVTFSKTGWWSGGLATAACLILLLTLFPQNTINQFEKTATSPTISKQLPQLDIASEEVQFELSEMMFYDTLEGF
ncbi:MAG TPA: hypothetical protein PLE43_06710 [Alphaproteobacteria bacterium]|jgi:hypothetical protein|nr:hypothetical protein [Alphaproteobacteria bacterium]MCB9985373.1 hypothetical protein [Micavibrio sp.]HPQ51094.1 hypothetical protein [Alphaproteobacteria bacterium]HRK98151.1 hypothetical protein [Alphaproteobacteria bacterium]